MGLFGSPRDEDPGGTPPDRAGHYSVPILEAPSGYESSRTVVFRPQVELADVLRRVDFTFESIRSTSAECTGKAIASVYAEDYVDYQQRVSGATDLSEVA